MSDEISGGFRGRRGGFRPSGPREMHKATCADCSKETEVTLRAFRRQIGILQGVLPET